TLWTTSKRSAHKSLIGQAQDLLPHRFCSPAAGRLAILLATLLPIPLPIHTTVGSTKLASRISDTDLTRRGRLHRSPNLGSGRCLCTARACHWHRGDNEGQNDQDHQDTVHFSYLM